MSAPDPIKLTAFLIWLVQEGGAVDASHHGLSRYSDDFEPIDTVGAALTAGLAQEVQDGDGWFTVSITPAGRAALSANQDATHGSGESDRL